MIRVIIRLNIYKRPWITSLCFEGLRRATNDFKKRNVDLKIVPVVSTQEDLKIVPDWVEKPFFYKNLPVGEKCNAGMRYILDNYDFDYILGFGSDDFFTYPGIALIEAYLKMGLPFFGFTDLYIVNSEDLRAKRYSGNTVFGAGRAIRRDLLDYTMKEVGYIWEDHKNRGLDGSSGNTISQATKVSCATFHQPYPVIVDLKSKENINGFNRFPAKEVDYYRLVPELEKVEARVKSLRRIRK